MKRKIFVTGAAGFIGFHLAKHLHEHDYLVIGYDNFNDYYPVALKKHRANELKKIGIEIIEGDICDENKLQEAAKGATDIVHLAAQAGVRYSLQEPKKYLETNINGFLNILELCRQDPTVKLTYASSSSVYGKNETLPFAVDDITDRQTSLYGVTKKTNELMAHSYHHLFGIRAIGLRFFTVYGSWGRPDMAYYSFADAIMKGKPIDIYNHGKMKRDFTYIDDIIAGTVAAMNYDGNFEVFNLGNNCSEELMYLVHLLEKNLNKKAIIKSLPMQKGDVVATYADISQSAVKLNFSPKTNLENGIEKFVSWYKDYGNLQKCDL